MSLWNASDFNANPACFDVGPTEPASDPYRTAQFAAFLTISVAMCLSSLFLLYMRQYRRRLRLRGPLPIFLGSFGGIILIMIRSGYDFVGREYFPCSLNVALYYLVVPLTILPDMVSSSAFLSKQYQRHLLNANTLQALEKKVQEHANRDERSYATVTEFFQGLWDFFLNIGSLLAFKTLDRKLWYHSIRKPSLLRETTYELILVAWASLPFIIALILRIVLAPRNQPNSGCTGCIIEWEDLLICNAFVCVYIVPCIALIYTIKSQSIPDPLLSLLDIQRSAVLTVPLFIITIIMLLLDPNNLMQSQQVDWHIFEMVAIFILHLVRTSFQVMRTRRLHKLGEKNVNLIDILADGRGSLLFEKHLIGELANENLLFWREAIKYKLQFDRSHDLEYSQQMAKVLWRTFLSPHASLPINISDSVKRTIDSRFKGTVGKNVFDEALAEVYLMMQNGAFQRFIHSAPFKEYASSKADFSMSTVFNPMSIVPSVAEDGVSTPIHMDIKEYIRTL